MKHLTILLAIFFFTANLSAQTPIKREGTTFVQEKSQPQHKASGFTYRDSKGQEYPIYISNTGSCYILKVSQKSGETYRKYLGEEISTQVCKELGIPYQPKTKSK